MGKLNGQGSSRSEDLSAPLVFEGSNKLEEKKEERERERVRCSCGRALVA